MSAEEAAGSAAAAAPAAAAPAAAADGAPSAEDADLYTGLQEFEPYQASDDSDSESETVALVLDKSHVREERDAARQEAAKTPAGGAAGGGGGGGGGPRPVAMSATPRMRMAKAAAMMSLDPNIVMQVQQLLSGKLYDLDTMTEKPWLEPGADTSDYFNYGFVEETYRTFVALHKVMLGEPQRQTKIAVFEGGSDAGKSTPASARGPPPVSRFTPSSSMPPPHSPAAAAAAAGHTPLSSGGAGAGSAPWSGPPRPVMVAGDDSAAGHGSMPPPPLPPPMRSQPPAQPRQVRTFDSDELNPGGAGMMPLPLPLPPAGQQPPMPPLYDERGGSGWPRDYRGGGGGGGGSRGPPPPRFSDTSEFVIQRTGGDANGARRERDPRDSK